MKAISALIGDQRLFVHRSDNPKFGYDSIFHSYREYHETPLRLPRLQENLVIKRLKEYGRLAIKVFVFHFTHPRMKCIRSSSITELGSCLHFYHRLKVISDSLLVKKHIDNTKGSVTGIRYSQVNRYYSSAFDHIHDCQRRLFVLAPATPQSMYQLCELGCHLYSHKIDIQVYHVTLLWFNLFRLLGLSLSIPCQAQSLSNLFHASQGICFSNIPEDL